MKNNPAISLTELKNAPVFTRIAILIYWAASLQYLYTIFPHRTGINPASTLHAPVTLMISTAAFLFALGVLKLFLAFKLSTRKNWARIVVVAISTLLAAFLIYAIIYGAIIIAHLPILSLLKSTYGLFSEVVAASLLLLPQSRDWFAPKKTNA